MAVAVNSKKAPRRGSGGSGGGRGKNNNNSRSKQRHKKKEKEQVVYPHAVLVLDNEDKYNDGAGHNNDNIQVIGYEV